MVFVQKYFDVEVVKLTFRTYNFVSLCQKLREIFLKNEKSFITNVTFKWHFSRSKCTYMGKFCRNVSKTLSDVDASNVGHFGLCLRMDKFLEIKKVITNVTFKWLFLTIRMYVLTG